MKRNRIAAVILSVTVAITLAACGTQGQTTGESGAAVSEEDTQSEEAVKIPDPFTEVGSLEEAAEITGFSLSVPEAPKDYPDMSIRVMDDSMIEVVFSRKTESEEAAVEAYRIRKAAGTDDISGDYNTYDTATNVETTACSVEMKGNGDTVSVAVWNHDGYTYAMDINEAYPLSAEDVINIVNAIE